MRGLKLIMFAKGNTLKVLCLRKEKGNNKRNTLKYFASEKNDYLCAIIFQAHVSLKTWWFAAYDIDQGKHQILIFYILLCYYLVGLQSNSTSIVLRLPGVIFVGQPGL